MKTNARSVYDFLIPVLFLLVSCNNQKESYQPEGLRKLTYEEHLQLVRKRQPVDMEVVTFKNEQVEIIPPDSLSKMSRGDFFGDQYVNEEGEIIEIVIRRATEQDKERMAELQSAWNEGPEMEIGEVVIECEKIDSILQAIHDTDQEMRLPENSIDQNIDFSHLEVVINLIKQCGMPTLDQVSQKGMNAVWLVFQHTIYNKYRKEYLPLLKQAARNGDLVPGNIAMMEDRILMNEYKPQLYGTQVVDHGDGWKLYELADPETVDQRRVEVGLGPLKEYLSHWDIEFEVEQRR